MLRLRIITSAFLLTLLCGGAFGHDGMHGMKGTVMAITEKTITIETVAGKTEVVLFDAKTAFVKSGTPAAAKDLKVGDRAIVEAHDLDGKMHAVKVRFGKPAKPAADKKRTR